MELNSSRITHVACVYSQKIFMQRKLGQLGLCTVDYMWHSVESKYRIDDYSYTYVTFCIISSLFPVSVLIPSVCGLLSTKLDIYKNMKYHISLCEVFCLEITYQSPIKSLKKKINWKQTITYFSGNHARFVILRADCMVTMLCTSTLCYVEVGLQRLTLTVVHLEQDFILSGERLKPFFRQSMLYHHHRNLLSNQYPF